MTKDRVPMTAGEFFERMAEAMNCNSNDRDRACFTAGVLAAVAIHRLDSTQLESIWDAFDHGWPSGSIHGAVGAMKQFLNDHPRTVGG